MPSKSEKGGASSGTSISPSKGEDGAEEDFVAWLNSDAGADDDDNMEGQRLQRKMKESFGFVNLKIK